MTTFKGLCETRSGREFVFAGEFHAEGEAVRWQADVEDRSGALPMKLGGALPQGAADDLVTTEASVVEWLKREIQLRRL